jgi:hypothetical protein
VPVVKREEQNEQENQITRKRALADDHEEGEIFDELDKDMDDEFFSSLHPDRKKQRLTSTMDLRVDPLTFRAAEPQTAGWRDIDLEDQMSLVDEQEAPSCLGYASFGILCLFANNFQQHLLCRLPKISQETRSSSVSGLAA